MADQPITSRREFVKKGLTLLGTSATVPFFVNRLAWALGNPLDAPLVSSVPGVPDHRTLVIVQLAGGNDGLNTVIPFRQDDYYKNRPRIAVRPRDVLKVRGDLGFHPSATGLKSLYDQGRLAVVQGVGYPNPNRSHFVSTEIWETGSPDLSKKEGWVGRYFDHTCSGSDPAPADHAVALTRETPLSMRGRDFQGVVFTDLQSLQWKGIKDKKLARTFDQLNAIREPKPGESPHLPYLSRVAMDARLSAERMEKALKRSVTGAYPRTRFGDSLKTICNLIVGEVPTRVFYVSLGGFDTHSNQANRHAQLMAELGKGLEAFVGDLDKHDQLDRVTVMTFSEFGRRVNENASGGTDHGEAAPLFIAGNHIRAGIHGRHPNLGKLRRGDLAYTTDFREVYASLLDDWMGTESHEVLGKRVKPLKLIRT